MKALPLIGILTLGAAAAQAAAPATAREASSSPECTMHLVVQATPDVTDPQDRSFLSSLISAHPGYQLSSVKPIDVAPADTPFVAADLAGPGPAARCMEVVDSIRHDSRVMWVHEEPDDLASVSIAAQREPEKTPRLAFSPQGFGALYWAARHPSQAWRILLPVESPEKTE